MIPVESQAVAEVMFWWAIVIIAAIVCAEFFCYIFGSIEETPEEQAAREAERIAKQATKEYKRRKRVRSVRFWNF